MMGKLNILIEQGFIQLLFAADLFRFTVLQGQFPKICKGQFTLFKRFAVAFIEGGVTLFAKLQVMPPIWAMNISSRPVEFLRVLASKFTPPVVKPPAWRITSMASVNS
jgi:hypothetical protein